MNDMNKRRDLSRSLAEAWSDGDWDRADELYDRLTEEDRFRLASDDDANPYDPKTAELIVLSAEVY